jgi:hypothetical protein
LRALHKHRNRYPDTLIDVDHENFFLIAKKNRDAGAGRRHCADLYFDNRLTHVGSLVSHVASGYRILRGGQIVAGYQIPDHLRSPAKALQMGPWEQWDEEDT